LCYVFYLLLTIKKKKKILKILKKKKKKKKGWNDDIKINSLFKYLNKYYRFKLIKELYIVKISNKLFFFIFNSLV